MTASPFIAAEVAAIHQPNICATGKDHLHYFPSFSLPEISMNKSHLKLLRRNYRGIKPRVLRADNVSQNPAKPRGPRAVLGSWRVPAVTVSDAGRDQANSGALVRFDKTFSIPLRQNRPKASRPSTCGHPKDRPTRR